MRGRIPEIRKGEVAVMLSRPGRPLGGIAKGLFPALARSRRGGGGSPFGESKAGAVARAISHARRSRGV